MTTGLDVKLPSCLQPGDKAALTVTIKAATFEKGTPDKVYYDVEWGDGDGAHRVDSCDLTQIMTADQIEAELQAGRFTGISLTDPNASANDQ